jgi:serine/threonine protein phosphatase 1
MRLLAIGDIHGCYQALDALAQKMAFTAGDTVVTVGDYVDRGPQSRQVIDFLIGLARHSRLIPLRGNHEVMMLQARESLSGYKDWLTCGGMETLESYLAENLQGISPEHWNFIERTLPFYEGEKDFFVHANAYANHALADQPEYMLYWEKFDFQPPHMSGKRMICGHTPQRNGSPLDTGHAVCIDTWVYNTKGWLTCLDVRSGFYWQANQKGETRQAMLETA